MPVRDKRKIESAKRIKKYHCLKIVEGVMKDDKALADRHLMKLINTRIGNKINNVINNENLV